MPRSAPLVRAAVLWAVHCGAALSLASAQERPAGPGVPVSLPLTYEHRLRSALTGRDFIIWVSLPPAYDTSARVPARRWPTLYLLDGRQSLQLALPMLRLTNRGPSGGIILVGVGYPFDARGLPSCGAVLCRDVDYIPPPFGGPPPGDGGGLPPGGADVFLRVLKDEIIPFVEARYATNSDRGLYGYSQGGLFAVYALFEAPDLFSRYAAVSPALGWDVDGMLRRERAFRERTPTLQKVLYMSVGAAEAPYLIADTWRMVGALCDGMFGGKAYRQLTLLAAIHADEDHRSAVHIARALGALYPPDSSAPVQAPVRNMERQCRRQ